MSNFNSGDNKLEPIVNSSFTAKAQTIDPETKLSGFGAVLSGDINTAVKSTIVGGRDVIGGGPKGTEGTHILGNHIIVGDAKDLTATTFTGGADRITLEGMDKTGAYVMGDAISAYGGSTRGGNDTIIIEGDVTGGTIIGDVDTVTNTTFTAGNDNILLKGDVSNATIYTDARTLSGANTLLGGNDSITLGIAPTKANPIINTTVSDTNINLGHGNDVLTAYSSIENGAEIRGGTGNDKFIVHSMDNAPGSSSSWPRLWGDDGNDTFILTDMNSGSISGGDDNDTFTVTNMNNGVLWGDDGNDKFTISTMLQFGNVHSGNGNDTVTLTTMNGGTIHGGTSLIASNGVHGADSIVIKNASNAKIYGDSSSNLASPDFAYNDIIKVTGLSADMEIHGNYGNDSITITTASNSNIYGDDNDDIITITTVSGGSVNGGANDDKITIRTLQADDNNMAGSVDGGENDDTITITTSLASNINGGTGLDNIKVITATASNIDAGADDDIITITTATASDIDAGEGNNTINITTANDGNITSDTGRDNIKVSTVNYANIHGGAGDDTITINTLNGSIHGGEVNSGADNDTITITTMTDATINASAGDDSVKIITLKGEHNKINLSDGADTLTINNFTANKDNIGAANALNMGEGDDSLNILAKKTNYSDTDFANALGVGDDTLNVNWAFNGTFTSSETPAASAGDPATPDNNTLITKGLGAQADLVFGAGNDNLTITGAASGNKSSLSDTGLAESLGAGQDTLDVGWAFNGAFSTADNEGGTLITRGLNANSTLQFGTGHDGLHIMGTLANRQINTLDGADTVNISGAATNVQVDLGEGEDVFSVGSMGKFSTLTYDTNGLDDITIKGTYNNGMVVDANDNATALSTGTDGGSITLDTLGTGLLNFGGFDTNNVYVSGDDNLTINKNVAGTATIKKEINTGDGDDNIDLKGTVTNTIIDAGTGNDTVIIGALSTGSMLKYSYDGIDDITIKGTYNDGFAQSFAFYGLATDALAGTSGGSITLDTLGTGKLQFGYGDDTLTINKALSGTFGLKDIFMQDGEDVVTLNTVNGAVINGAEGDDKIFAIGLGATGVLKGGFGEDIIQIGRAGLDTVVRPLTATMSNGVIDGGDENDSIIIGNQYVNGKLYGTLSGGKVYGGLGVDTITTTTLSGTALMHGGDGFDIFTLTNMSGGTIEGGDGNDSINISGTFSGGTIEGGNGNDTVNISGTFSGGTINGGLGEDRIDIATMSGGAINDDTGNNYIFINNFKGGVIDANNAGWGSVVITTMTGGSINLDGNDTIYVTTMTGGSINLDGNDSITVTTMAGGTINGNDGDDTITGIYTMTKGTINGRDGDDSITVDILDGGIINAGEGDNYIFISDLNSGSIIAGKGNDTLGFSGIGSDGKYSINLGAGENEIRVTNLTGQELTFGATHDNVNLLRDTSNAKINLGAGNDTILGNITAIKAIIDAGSGDDSIDIGTAQSSIIDLGTGNNTLNVGTATTNTIITGGSGHDNITVNQLNAYSSIFASTGNDTIDVGKIVSSIITYDNRGQDVIKLDDYDGTGIENTYAPTSHAKLSTGTDGGSIELGTWTSGAITFGNGHDGFVLHGDLADKGEVKFFQGNDSIKVTGDITNSIISYDNRGQDSIDLDNYTGAEIQNTYGSDSSLSTGTDGGSISLDYWTGGSIKFGKGNDAFRLSNNTILENIDLATGKDSITVDDLNDETGPSISYNNDGFDSITIGTIYKGTGIAAQDGKLSTGAGGGFIRVSEITTEGIKNLAFNTGNVNESFFIGTFNNTDMEGTIDLGQGADSIYVGTIDTQGTATIKYDSAGFDSITIDNFYDGTGIGDQNGKLSTGNDGGFISIVALASRGGVAGLEFSDKNDIFKLDTFNVAGEDSVSTIYLKSGNDSISIVEFYDGSIDAGAGNDSVTVGNVNNSLSGLNGGTIDLGAGNDKVTITTLDDGKLYAGTGNDYISITNFLHGKLDGGAGNDTYSIENLGNHLGGDFAHVMDNGGGIDVFDIVNMHYASIENNGNTGRGTYDVEYLAHSNIYGLNGLNGASGLDSFNIGEMERESTIFARGGNDSIKVNSVDNSSIHAGEGDDKITVGSFSNSEPSVDTSINGDAGNDTFDITTISGGDVNGGADNDTFIIDNMTGGTVDGGAGKNTYTIEHMLTGTVQGSSDGLDSVKIITMDGGTVDTGVGKDTLSITNFNGGTIYGGDSGQTFIDTFNITHMQSGATLIGGDGDNNVKVSNMYGGSIDLTAHVGESIINVSTAYGGTIEAGIGIMGDIDHITIGDATDLTIHGDEIAGIFYPTLSYDDIIKITGTARDTNINGGYGNDNISVTTGIGNAVDGGFSINGDQGNDTITITTLNRGNIAGGAGTDLITIKNAYNSKIYANELSKNEFIGDSIKITGVADNTVIYGAHGVDTIQVGTLTNSTIQSNYGEDTIYVSNQINSTVTFSNLTESGDAEYDTILLSGGIGAGATVNLDGSGSFNLAKSQNANGDYTGFNMSGGELNIDVDRSNIYLATMSGGSISTNTTEDTITIANAISKTISIENKIGEADNLYLTKGISAGANITLGGDGGFNVAKNAAGDGLTMTGGALMGSNGADSFTLASMTGGTLSGGAGADSISAKISGASKGILDGGDGNDTFVINATKNSSITIQELEAGDTLTINTEDATTKAKEALAAGSQSFDFTTTNGVKVTVNFATIGEQKDYDEVSITNKTIIGTTGADTINITGTATNSKIYGRDNIDTITVKTLTNSEIHGEAQADSISVTTMNSGLIDGGTGADDITITTMNGGRIDGGADADTITITNQVKKAITIANESGQDNLYLNNSIGSGGNISLEGAGFVVAKNDNGESFSLASGTINGSASDDTFYIDKMSGATLNANGGEDAFYLETMTNGTIKAGDGDDIFSLTTLNGGNLNGDNGADTFIITTMSKGTLNGGAGVDNIQVTTMTNGTINGGDGADSISVTTMTGGSIDGGAGADTVHVNGLINKTITIKNTGTEHDNLRFGVGFGDDDVDITTGGHLILSGNTGFLTNSFDMDGGTLTGSAGSDTINLSDITGGTINAGAGDDRVYEDGINGLSGSRIDLGSGNDTLIIREATLAKDAKASGGTGYDVLGFNSSVGSLDDWNLANRINDNFTNFEAIQFGRVQGGHVIGYTDKANHIIINNNMDSGSITGGAKDDIIEVRDAEASYGALNGGTINGGAGNDTISVANMSGGAIDGGAGIDVININEEIADSINIKNTGTERDVLNLNGGIATNNTVTLESTTHAGQAGEDTISSFNVTIKSMDANSILNTSLGDDSITIYSLHNSSASDATINIVGGQDTIVLDTEVENAITINNQNSQNHGTVLVTGGVVDGADISLSSSGAGFIMAESFNAKTKAFTGFDMSGGTVDGSDGNDTIIIDTMSAGTINGADGDDSFTVSTMNGGTIDGGTGDDYFSVSTMNGGTIDGGDDHDTLFFNVSISNTVNINSLATNIEVFEFAKLVSGGIINGTTGNDHISLKTIPTAGIVNGGEGADTLSIDGSINRTVKLDSITNEVEAFEFEKLVGGGNIIGTDGADSITVTNMTGGSIDGGAGADTVNLTGVINKTITIKNTGTEQDLIRFGTFGDADFDITKGGHVILSGNAGFVVNAPDMDGGALTGSAGADTISISDMTGGTINAGAGDDYFADSSLNITGGKVDLGSGNDTIILDEDTLGSDFKASGGAGYDVLGFSNSVSEEWNLADKINDNFTNFEAIRFGRVQGGHVIGYTDKANHIIINSNMDDGTITGGSKDDLIEIRGSDTSSGALNDGTITGGAGDDTLIVYADGTHADLTIINGVIDDSIEHVYFDNLMNGGSITGTDRGDDIIVIKMDDGTINAGDGDDEIILKSIPTGGTINGGNGNDTFILTVNLDTDLDLDTLTNDVRYYEFEGLVNGGNLTGTDGDDFITISTMTGGTINTGDGDDSISISTLPTNGIINGGDHGFGGDTLAIDVTINRTLNLDDTTNNVEVFEIAGIVNGGSLIGTDDADHITVTTMTGGSIDGGAGRDTITITDEVKSKITLYNNDTEYDLLYFGGAGVDAHDITEGANIILTGNGGFSIGRIEMDGGTLNASAGADSIYITKLSAGKIAMGAGDDHMYLEKPSEVTGGNIDMGTGNDTFAINASVLPSSGATVIGGAGYDVLGFDSVNFAWDFATRLNNPNFINFEAVQFNTIVAGADITGYANEANHIIIKNSMTGGTLTGGAQDDLIEARGTLSGGTISGGAGVDTLIVYADATEANMAIIIGMIDDSIEHVYFDNLMNGGKIIGTASNDTITVRHMADGTINAEAGDDKIILTSVPTNGTINGGAGVDTLSFTADIDKALNLNGLGNEIEAFAFAALVDGGSIYGTSGNDVITVSTMSGGSIHAGGGDDSISLSAVPTEGIINGEEGRDTLSLNTSINNTVNLADITASIEVIEFDGIVDGGNIIGTANNDSIIITSVNGGSIDGGEGTDTIHLANAVDKTIHINNSGSQDDRIYLAGGVEDGANIILTSEAGFTLHKNNGGSFDMSGGNLSGSAGAEHMSIATMSGGTISTNGGDDTIIMTTLSGGNINGNDGNDSFHFVTIAGGQIDGGEGMDTIGVYNAISNTVNIHNSGTERDFIWLENGIAENANLNLISDVGFEVGQGNGLSFKLANGTTLTASAGSDVIHIFEMGVNSKVYGEDGNDTINVIHVRDNPDDGSGNDAIVVDPKNGRVVEGGAGDDVITIRDIFNADGKIQIHLDGGEGNDILFLNQTINSAFNLTTLSSQVFNFEGFDFFHLDNGGSILGSNEADHINVGGMNIGSTLSSDAGNDTIRVTQHFGGQIDGGAGNDFITSTMLTAEGEISGGAGDDTLTIILTGDQQAVNIYGDSSSDADAGADKFDIHGDNGNSITIHDFDFNEGDTLFINHIDITEEATQAQATGSSLGFEGVTIYFS